MLITSSSILEGKHILEYKGLAFADSSATIDFVSVSQEELIQTIIKTRRETIDTLIEQAEENECNAVIDIKFNYEIIPNFSLFIINASGSVVRTANKKQKLDK